MPVLFFGQAREITGREEIPWRDLLAEQSDIPPATVGHLRALLVQKYPELERLSSLAIAVNSQYATDDVLLAKEDEIAVIPPVSGG